MNSNITKKFTLQPLKKRHERKTLATDTLRKINGQLQYYRRILNQPEPNTSKEIKQRQKIQQKYDYNVKVRD